MATEFYVDLNDFSEWNRQNIPQELVSTAVDGKLQIGTSRSNGNRKNTLVNLVQERYGEWQHGTFSEYMPASIEELRSSTKPYFSKWSKEAPIEFFETPVRFSWYIPVHLQKPDDEIQSQEEFQRGMIEFWNSFLEDMTPVYHGSNYPIKTWRDLMEAIIGNLLGDNKYMESSMLVEGNINLFG